MDPMKVDCPTCKQKAGERCKTVVFGNRALDGTFVHMARTKLAKQVEDAMVEGLLAELDKWGMADG